MVRLVGALGSSAASACLGAWVLRRVGSGRRAWALVAASAAGVLASPALVPADRPGLRLLAALWSVTVAAKLWDAAVGALAGCPPTFPAFPAALPNVFSLVARRAKDLPKPSRRDDFRRLARASAGSAAGLAAFCWVFRADWSGRPFWVEHASKVGALFLALIPLSTAGASAARLLGVPALDPMDRPYAARTPAEFWRRYNRPAGRFFDLDVFRPAGGLRAPARAALATFVASAAVHEYLFAVPLGRVQGYQTAFFLTQGLASWATRRVRPRGPAASAGVAATLAFNLATSALFFASVGAVLPFYRRG